MNEIREVEREAREEQEEAERLDEQVDEHRRRAERLEEAVTGWQSLWVQGEGTRQSLEAAEKMKQETERRLGELRQDRDALVQRNEELTRQCQQALEQSKEAATKLPWLLGEVHADQETAGMSGIAEAYQEMERGLGRHLDEVSTQVQELQAVRGRLEALDL